MASYAELRSLISDSALQNKVQVACAIAADTIKDEDGGTINHTNRLLWAKRAFGSLEAVTKEMFPAVLAANKAAAVNDIANASDTAIQSNVDATVNLFADGT